MDCSEAFVSRQEMFRGGPVPSPLTRTLRRGSVVSPGPIGARYQTRGRIAHPLCRSPWRWCSKTRSPRGRYSSGSMAASSGNPSSKSVPVQSSSSSEGAIRQSSSCNNLQPPKVDWGRGPCFCSASAAPVAVSEGRGTPAFGLEARQQRPLTLKHHAVACYRLSTEREVCSNQTSSGFRPRGSGASSSSETRRFRESSSVPAPRSGPGASPSRCNPSPEASR